MRPLLPLLPLPGRDADIPYPRWGRKQYNSRETAKRAKITVHVLLFLLAVVVLYLGLGVGLQVSPILSTLLWVAAAVIAALNLFWVVRSHQ